jgi:anti-sigma regulatory factor (Ser/Thr protein kinase)
VARIDINALTSWITAAAARHPLDLADALAAHTGVTRATAGKALKRLVELQWLAREGTARKPLYRAGPLRQIVQRYELAGLDEDRPWTRDFAPHFELPATVRRMAQHAFGELLNNAIDHSGGRQVTVSMRQTPAHLQLLVSDDGCGLFERLRESFALDDPALAMLELSKGRLTSQPLRHGGRGLFFTSRLADVFDLHANHAAFQRRHWEAGRWHAGKPLGHGGTSVYVAIALDTPRTLESVVAAHSLDGRGGAFDSTHVPLALLASELDGLESRAQGRRIAARLGQFRRAEIDFRGIPEVGYSFVDELFRVQAGSLPQAELVPVNMSASVAALVASVRNAS